MSNNNGYSMESASPTPDKDGFRRYRIVPSGVDDSSSVNSVNSEYGVDSSTIFDDEDLLGMQSVRDIIVKGKPYKYVQWGVDDQLPYRVRKELMGNMVTAQCQQFNIVSCYGQGVRFVDRKTKSDVSDKEILDFCLRNSLQEVFLEQTTDIKFYSFSVTVIILSRDGEKIVTVRNKDASYCRFEYAPSTRSGGIEHVFYGDFRTGFFDESKIETIPLLDYWNPLGDLLVRMGKEPDPVTGLNRKPTTDRKFAIVSRMATPGCQYYPVPYYYSIFRDAWFDIYRLIGIGKRYMIKNTSAPRVQIEVHDDYWDNVCDNEGITDETKRRER